MYDRKKGARQAKKAHVKADAKKALAKIVPVIKRLREVMSHPAFHDCPQGVIAKAF